MQKTTRFKEHYWVELVLRERDSVGKYINRLYFEEILYDSRTSTGNELRVCDLRRWMMRSDRSLTNPTFFINSTVPAGCTLFAFVRKSITLRITLRNSDRMHMNMMLFVQMHMFSIQKVGLALPFSSHVLLSKVQQNASNSHKPVSIILA